MTRDGAATESAYALVYEEGRQAVAAQQDVIDSYGSRAGLLLSGAAIATSFLGGVALRSGDPGPWSWIAIVAFALLGVATLAILWPTSWASETGPRIMIATYVEAEKPLPLEIMLRDLALHRSDLLARNSRRLRRLAWAVRFAGFLLLTEIVAWAIDLATRVD